MSRTVLVILYWESDRANIEKVIMIIKTKNLMYEAEKSLGRNLDPDTYTNMDSKVIEAGEGSQIEQTKWLDADSSIRRHSSK